MMIKHATASTFVFHRFGEQAWRLGLVKHPRLGKYMIVGGHVEAHETQAEAAVREAREESGLEVRLLALPTPALPSGYPHPEVPAPWWINEMRVPVDNHLNEPHVHVDHQYVAVADSRRQTSKPAHPFAWYALEDLPGLDMVDDTRMLAERLLPMISSVAEAADASDGHGRILRVLAAAGMN